MVVGWEGADWTAARPLIDAGHLPVLESLIRGGCSGPIRGFSPWLPPVLWTTLATGAPPDRHGLHGVAVFDDATEKTSIAGPQHRRVPAIWNLLSAHGHSSVVLGWPGTFPAETLPHGMMVSDAFTHAPLAPNDAWPVPAAAVSPAARGADLAEFRLRPEEIDPALLGLFLPKLTETGRASDPRPSWLLHQLSELYTLHNTAVVLCSEAQPDFLAVHFPLIETTGKAFGVFQSPRHPAASSTDCERYGGVVSSAYRLQDALLGDLIDACQPDTAIVVVSTHGVAHGAARPPRLPRTATDHAAWCRPHGLLVMKGPGIQAGASIAGARLEDLAPTLLTWFDLARGAHMSGRLLAEIFISPPTETTTQNPGALSDGFNFTALTEPLDSNAGPAIARMFRRLIGQHLVHPLTGSSPEIARLLGGENAFLLGTALLSLHRAADALAPLHQAFLASPESAQRALSLIHCLMRLGLMDEAISVAQLFLDHGPRDSRHRLVSAALQLNRKRPEAALELLGEVTEPELAENRRVLERMAFSGLRRHADEAASFRQSLHVQPDAAELWLGLARAQLHAGEFGAASSSAAHACALDEHLHDAAQVLEDAQAAVRTGGRPEALPNPPATTWPRLTRKAIARQTLRAALREQAARHRADRTRSRSAREKNQNGDTIASLPNAPVFWQVRPPWPDETPRIEAHFAPALRHLRVSKCWIWVLTADTTERLAGVVVLNETRDAPHAAGEARRQGRVDLEMRDAWIDTPAGDALLTVVLRHAAAAGLTSLNLQARVGEEMDALLRRHGFAETIRHEVWTASLTDAIASQQAEYGRVLTRWPVQIGAFQAEQLEIARAICSGTGLLTPDKVVLKSLQHPRGIEPALSFVAGPPDEPVAVLLGRIDGAVADLEIVARNPASPTAAPAAVPALLLRFLLAAQDLGCLEVRCSMRPELTPTLITLMKKWRGRRQQQQALHRRSIA